MLECLGRSEYKSSLARAKAEVTNPAGAKSALCKVTWVSIYHTHHSFVRKTAHALSQVAPGSVHPCTRGYCLWSKPALSAVQLHIPCAALREPGCPHVEPGGMFFHNWHGRPDTRMKHMENRQLFSLVDSPCLKTTCSTSCAVTKSQG